MKMDQYMDGEKKNKNNLRIGLKKIKKNTTMNSK